MQGPVLGVPGLAACSGSARASAYSRCVDAALPPTRAQLRRGLSWGSEGYRRITYPCLLARGPVSWVAAFPGVTRGIGARLTRLAGVVAASGGAGGCPRVCGGPRRHPFLPSLGCIRVHRSLFHLGLPAAVTGGFELRAVLPGHASRCVGGVVAGAGGGPAVSVVVVLGEEWQLALLLPRDGL